MCISTGGKEKYQKEKSDVEDEKPGKIVAWEVLRKT